MSLHHLLPLIALILNVCLALLALLRNSGSRLNRVFAAFLGSMAVWNFGVFMLRRAPDPESAAFWEVVIHAGVVALPAFYYHFVLVFLDSTVERRGALVAVYALSAAFFSVNLLAPPFFMTGARWTTWGWAPIPGPLYGVFLVHFYVFLVAALCHLGTASRPVSSGFRRHRTLLILLGTAIALAGGFVDIARFTLARALPALEALYPVGIPANTVWAVMVGLAIVRYRMFDVSVAVKKAAVYGALGATVMTALVALAWSLGERAPLPELTALWVIAPLGFVFTLLLTPAGRPLEAWIERLTFSRPRGCHDTLVALSKRMSLILDSGAVVDTLVDGLVRGIPLTHCALLLRDEGAGAFVVRREESATGETTGLTAVAASSLLVQWLARTEGVLVKEEAMLDRRVLRHFAAAPGELEDLRASLVVPLKIDNRVSGILLLGEKLSGEIFAAQELEVLSVLANQAAIALQNAHLYERAERERRRLEVLYAVSRRLASVEETEDLLGLVVNETRRLLGADVAALRLVDGDELVLRACTAPALAHRRRLGIGESLTGLVVARDEPVMVEDVLADERYDPVHRLAAEASGLRSFLGVPLRAHGRPVGALYLYTSRRQRFGPDEVSLLSALADQASVVLDKGRLTTERRQAEEALRQSEKLATMGQLLAGVAHELNNPLTVIGGYAGLLVARLPDGALGEFARHIETAAERCGRIVRNFLALARKHPPERKLVALNQVVTEAVELLSYPLGVDGIQTTLDLAADLPPLLGDAHELQQVVVNLVTNAHHAMRQSEARRLTLTTRYDADRARVLLQVADTGPGIPREIQKRIFEPFFTTKPIGQGTGLGLSLCHGIVESHGGRLRVESEPGLGAVFTVELPAERPAEPDQRESGEEPPAALPPRAILVVDDEPPVASLLARILGADGHRVDTAAEAETALEMLTERSYDLIISDIRMPWLDGPGLYRAVSERWPARRPPFVFVTGDVLGAETLAFLESTGARRLSKPFARDDVRRTVRLALDTAGPA